MLFRIEGNSIYTLLVASVASICMGYNLSIFNISYSSLSNYFRWCDKPFFNKKLSAYCLSPFCPNAAIYYSYLNGGFFLAAACGSLFSGVMIDKLGRRFSLIFVFVLMLGTNLAASLSKSFIQLVISRTLSGVSCGMATVIPGVYMTEMCNLNLRIYSGFIPQIAVNMGILIGMLMGVPLHHKQAVCVENANEAYETLIYAKDVNVDLSKTFDIIWWRFIFGAIVPWCLFSLIILVYVFPYETPTYLRIKKKDCDSARKVELLLNFANAKESDLTSNSFRNCAVDCNNINIIVSNNVSHGLFVSKEKNLDTNTVVENDIGCNVLETDRTMSILPFSQCNRLKWIANFFPYKSSVQPSIIYKVLIGWTFSIAHQLTGISFFIASSTTLFENLQMPEEYVFFATTMIGLMGLVCAILSAFFIAKVPRRKILIGGAAAMALSFSPVIVHMALFSSHPKGHMYYIILIFSTICLIATYGVSYGPGLFPYLNELYPVKIKAFGLAIAFMINWLTCFVVVIFVPFLAEENIYLFFSMSCTAAAVIAYFGAPETLTN